METEPCIMVGEDAASSTDNGNVPAKNRISLHRAIFDYFCYLRGEQFGGKSAPAVPLHDDRTAANVDIDNWARQPTTAAINAATHSRMTGCSASVPRKSENIQRILDVLGQAFPEILSIPGEHTNDLELRFVGYPKLVSRVRDLESCVHGRLPCLPDLLQKQPTVATTAAAPPMTPPDPGIPLTPAGTTADVAATNHATSNDRKRRAPISNNNGIDGGGKDTAMTSGVAKKLKHQEFEIKYLKTQLQLNIKSKGHTMAGGEKKKLSKKSAESVDDLNEQRARAAEAAVSFEERFEELIHWKNGYGHCRVPCTDKDHPGLARWVQTLRSAYKEKQKRGQLYYGQLTEERAAKLEGIGFEWTVQAPKVSWVMRFEQLKQFKEQHGHCRIVRSYPQNPKLGEWCHRQRFLAHKNQLDEERVKMLSDIGFEIWVRKRGKNWDDHFSVLVQFRRQHHHINVPPPDSRTKMKQVISTASEAGEEGEHENIGKIEKSVSEDGELGPLSLDPVTEEYREEQAFRRWVAAQRDNYHLKFTKGVKSTLTKARVKKLNSLGFDWTREGGDNDLRRLRTGPLHHRNDPEIWNRRFQEVVEYKRRFGDCNVPKEWSENKPLGAWCATQRKSYKSLVAGDASSLTPERRNALESIGFTWIVRPARTSQKVLQMQGLHNAVATKFS